jgi:hypothetical protein
VHLPGRAEIGEALVAEHQATASQISNVVAQVYLFRSLALAVPIGAVIGNVQALASVRPMFFGGLIALLVALVAWQIVTGWVGTFQAWRGRGDMVMGTFLVRLLGVPPSGLDGTGEQVTKRRYTHTEQASLTRRVVPSCTLPQ